MTGGVYLSAAEIFFFVAKKLISGPPTCMLKRQDETNHECNSGNKSKGAV